MAEILLSTQMLIDKVDDQATEIHKLKQTCLDFQTQITNNKIKIKNLSHVLDNNTKVLDNDVIELKKTIDEMKKTIADLKSSPLVPKHAKVTSSPSPPTSAAPKPIKQGVKRKSKDAIRDELIARLINGKKKSKPWSSKMSKYSSITYISSQKKWLWQSHIFDEDNQTFNTKEDAESFYEKIVSKFDIPFEYITRNGYVDGAGAGAGAGAGTDFEDDEVVEEYDYDEEVIEDDN